MSVPAAARAVAPGVPRLLLLGLLGWGAAAAGGLGVLAHYSSRPGVAAASGVTLLLYLCSLAALASVPATTAAEQSAPPTATAERLYQAWDPAGPPAAAPAAELTPLSPLDEQPLVGPEIGLLGGDRRTFGPLPGPQNATASIEEAAAPVGARPSPELATPTGAGAFTPAAPPLAPRNAPSLPGCCAGT